MSRVTEQPPHRSPSTDEAKEELGPKNPARPDERPSDDTVMPDKQQGASVGRKRATRRWGDSHNIARDDTPPDC